MLVGTTTIHQLSSAICFQSLSDVKLRILRLDEKDSLLSMPRALVKMSARLIIVLNRIDQYVGSTSGIRACALRNFDLGKMELENSQNNALAKLPMLKLGEYEMWEIRIKHEDDCGPLLLKKKICPRRMMSKPEEVFILYGAPKELQLTLTTSLDSIFTRLQKLVSRLAILRVDTPPEDLNLKFLRCLPSEWDTYVVKRTAAANNDDKNLAFLTTSSLSSTNTVNIVNTGVSTGNIKVNTASTASLSDATVYAFLSTQPQGSELVHEDLKQLHDDDLEEMDLKWNMALLSMRARKFYQRTRRKIIIDGSSTAGYDKSKVECFNCHKMGHFAGECMSTRRLRKGKGQGFGLRSASLKNHQKDLDQFVSKIKIGKKSFSILLIMLGKKNLKSFRENNDAPIIEDWVSDDEEEVEPIPKVEKKMLYLLATKKSQFQSV
ncbi:putative ribonuclease H-like domain-containing protein [Tanacetum coccineum]